MDGVGRVIEHSGGPASSESARSGARDSLFMMANLRIAGAPTVEVRVRNLSEGGLMVEFEGTVTPGAAVELDMQGLRALTGTVAWCTRGRVGIAFDQPIDPKRARKRVGAGRAAGHVTPLKVTRAPRR